MNIFNLFRRKQEPKPELVVLTEAEFDFLATGIQQVGLIEAQTSNDLELIESLFSKDLLKPIKSFPFKRCWAMTSKGIDIALSAKFTPTTRWYLFGNPDKRHAA